MVVTDYTHKKIHRLLDLSGDLDKQLEKYQSQLYTSLGLSRETVREQYALLRIFWNNFDALSSRLRRGLSDKIKQIVLAHFRLYQYHTGESIGLWTEGLLEQLSLTTSHEQLMELLKLDEEFVYAIVDRLHDLIQQEFPLLDYNAMIPERTSGHYIIPLSIGGRCLPNNQSIDPEHHKYMTIVNLLSQEKNLGKKRRSARIKTNHRILFGIEELRPWTDVQHRYFDGAESLLTNCDEHKLWQDYQSKIHQQALHDQYLYETTTQQSTYELASDLSLHDNLEQSLYFRGLLVDEIKSVLADKHYFFSD